MKRMIFAIAFAVVSFGAAAEDAPPSDAKVALAPEIHVGDWAVRHRAVGPSDRIQIKEIRPDGTMIVAQQGGSSLYTTIWGTIQSYGAKTGDPVSYSPAFPMLSFPLWKGKAWQASVDWTSGRYNGTMTVKVDVGDWTTVTVDGKVVEAIEVRYAYNDGTKTRCLYAPSVPFWAAKCESNNSVYAFEIRSFGYGTGDKISQAE